MNFRNVFVGWLLVLVAAAVHGEAPSRAQARAIGPGPVVVRTALGGFILGYDIDATGTLGILSEALARADGRHDVAVETFDQRTGAIVKVLRQELDSKDAFATLGVFGTAGGAGVGLTEYEHVTGLYVDRRQYGLTLPLSAGRLTGAWTPPFSAAEDIIGTGAGAYGSSQSVFLGFRNTANDFSSYVFSSDVGANTFGPVIRVTDPVFGWNVSPVIALDPARHRAVLGGSMGCFGCAPFLGLVDLQTGAQSTLPALGIGSVNGIAVDPTNGIVCTTTEDDFSVEFYDLVNGIQRQVTLPGAVSEVQSGSAVAVDPVHHLFLVGQEFSSTAPHGSSIQVFDEQGNFVESLNGFSLPASPAPMVLNPAKRAGFVIVTPDLTTLQSFRY